MPIQNRTMRNISILFQAQDINSNDKNRKTMLEGATVRNSYAGISNKKLAQKSWTILLLLKAGFTGEQDGIKSIFDGVVSSKFDDESAQIRITWPKI